MDGGNEQRVAINLCFKAGPSEIETLVLVQKPYGNEALNRSNSDEQHAISAHESRSALTLMVGFSKTSFKP